MSDIQPQTDTAEVRRALAALAKTGDMDAFACLYSLCHAGFIRIAYRLCGNSDAARDIDQEAAITMSRKIGGLKNPSAFYALGWNIMVWMAVMIFCGLLFFCIYKFFHADTVKMQIFYASGTVLTNSAQIAFKLWFHMRLNRRVLLREIRRLQLAIVHKDAIEKA